MMVRVLSPIAVPAGDLAPHHVGAGVTDVVACVPAVNPLFGTDPRTAPKDGDGVPLFAGDLGDCTTAPAELYQSTCVGPLTEHSFTLIWAVGPQFYTKQAGVDMEVLLTLEPL